MYHLLPKKHIAKIKTEYRLRLLLIAELIIVGAVFIGIILLLPALFVVHINKMVERSQLTLLQASNAKSGAGEYATLSVASREMLGDLAPVTASHSGYEYVDALLSHKTKAITLSSFNLSLNGAVISTMSVVGRADTRTDLLSFADALKKDGHFGKVDLPVSDLAKNHLIDFTINALLIQ